MSLECGEGQDRRAIRPAERIFISEIREISTCIELRGRAGAGTQHAMIRRGMRELLLVGIVHLYPFDARANADLDPAGAIT